MTNRRLKADLLRKLDVTPQRLSQRVQGLKEKLPMSTEDATYCVGHKAGLNLDKYLPQDKVDRVRDLLRQLGSSPTPMVVERLKARMQVKTRQVTLGGNMQIRDPILPEQVINDLVEMAGKVYPMLYLFENSVREVIDRLLRKRFGEDWWIRANVPQGIRTDVRQRQTKEEELTWHGKRGAHPIHYTNIDDLVHIVQNNWEVFKNIFRKQHWFANIVESMEVSRNTVAHMNPLKKHDIERVRVNLGDWQRHISARKGLIT